MRMANARIWWSLTKQLKNETVDGRPGGCLNASAGSAAFVQYSSSHSVGRSMSKLCGVGKWETKAHRRDVSRRLRCSKPHVGQRNKGPDLLFVLDRARPPEGEARPPVHRHQNPAHENENENENENDNKNKGERRADNGPSGYVVNVAPWNQ